MIVKVEAWCEDDRDYEPAQYHDQQLELWLSTFDEAQTVREALWEFLQNARRSSVDPRQFLPYGEEREGFPNMLIEESEVVRLRRTASVQQTALGNENIPSIASRGYSQNEISSLERHLKWSDTRLRSQMSDDGDSKYEQLSKKINNIFSVSSRLGRLLLMRGRYNAPVEAEAIGDRNVIPVGDIITGSYELDKFDSNEVIVLMGVEFVHKIPEHRYLTSYPTVTVITSDDTALAPSTPLLPRAQ